ncbi:hypothetical protein M0813_21129 [Anaeramoeba flamelloides]|uniref:Transcriptional regulator n=1 Tax=Anaeramoeba flamelloides TaxID=1746091 RepID=A0ABQ8YJ21_9EUKA|nr:hypothetical protein M0813_21129 [Anaeramoeba flamelloides]
MSYTLNTNTRSTQQQRGIRSQQKGAPIWNNRNFPHIFGTFSQSQPSNSLSLKDLIASETEFQQMILFSNSQIKKLENQRKKIENYFGKQRINIQQLSTNSNSTITATTNNTGNNNNNNLLANQSSPNQQTTMNNPRTRRQTRKGFQNNPMQPTASKPTKAMNNPNTLSRNIKTDPKIRKRKSPEDLTQEKSGSKSSTIKGFGNSNSMEITNTNKRQRNNAVSQNATNNQKRKKTNRRSNRKKNNIKEENSDDEIKRIIEQINFFDSEDNETDSEEDDFISTRTEPSKVWDHISPWLEEFTSESVEFLQQTDLIKEGYAEIPPLYQISWNFQDSPLPNLNENSQSHKSENTLKAQRQQKLRNEIDKSSRVFCRLLGSLIESDTKSSHLAHKNKRLVTQLDQLKNSYQYWKDPKDPRFPRKYNGTKTKDIISRSSQDTHSQIPIIQKNGNLSLKAISELMKVGLIIEPSSNLQQQSDPIYDRLKILMGQLHKVVSMNNKYKQQMYGSTKDIITKEKKWNQRFEEILALEKKYKDLIKQSNGKKKRRKRKK